MKLYPSLTDEELVACINQDDSRAFSALYQRYSELLLAYAYAHTHDKDDAEDVLQDLFTALWEKRHTIQIRSSVKAYLYRAVMNRILDRVDRSNYYQQYLASLELKIEKGTPAADEELLEKELLQQFETLLEKLPPKTREVFEYFRTHDKTRNELADDLKLSPKTINWHLQQVLNLIKRGLMFFSMLLF